MQGVKEWRNERNGFYVFRAHYSADPKKCSQDWKTEQSVGIPTNDWNREYEIDFSSFTGKAVFQHDYVDSQMVKAIKSSPKFPMLRSWDFGYHHPAVCFGQIINNKGQTQVRILESDMGEDIDFRLYVRHVLHLSNLFFPNREFLDCCDRAGDFAKSTGEKDKEVRILTNEFGIVPRFRYFEVDYTLGLLRKLMHANVKNALGQLEPGFIVNDSPSNALLREALRGGYHFAEKTAGRAEKEEPFQDGYYENIIDPVRYLVANFLGISQNYNKEMETLASAGIVPEKEALL